MKSSDILDSSRGRSSFNTSMLIVVITLVSLVISSSGALMTFTSEDFGLDHQIPTSVAGTRNDDNLTVEVLLINISGSTNSTDLFRELIMANSTYNLTEQSAENTNSWLWRDYDILVWPQGRKDTNASHETELRSFVLNGGHLLIEGANLAEHAGSTEFEDDVLHASSIDVTGLNNYVGQNLTKNAPAHPVASDPHVLSDPINYTSNDTSRLDSDVCDSSNGSVVVLEWGQVSNVNGTTVDNSQNYGGLFAFDDDTNSSNGGQIIFMSFAIALVGSETDRTEMMENALDWLIPIELEEYYGFHLTPDHQDQTTNSGGSTLYEILVVNNGTLDDTYDLHNEDPGDGWTASLNQTSVNVAAGKNTSISLTVTAPLTAQNGDFKNVSVWADSRGDGTLSYIVTTNTTVNNEARADLEPITLGPIQGLMVLGADTGISSIVRNNGDRDANNVIVTFYLDDITSQPIGDDTIDVPAGEETEAFIEWNATDNLGDHTLFVVVDPGQNHPETDETNNDLQNTTRDWTVLGHTSFTDASYNLTGNLSVNAKFDMNNVTLMFNSTEGAYGIYIEEQGDMMANGSRIRTLGTSGDSSFRFLVRGTMSLTNSNVRRTYYNDDLGDPRGGIEILFSSVVIENTTISHTGLGIWTTVSPVILNSTFKDIPDFGIYGLSGSPTISGSSFEGMSTAIVQKGGSPTIQGCEITDVSTGIFITQLATGLINGNSIHDLNGLERGIHILDASPLVTYNEIHFTTTAIWVQGEDAYPTISWNDLSDNSHNSAYCSDAYPTFIANVIEDVGKYGINIIGGSVVVRDSFFSNNDNRAILVHTAELTLDNVTFHGDDDDNDYDEGIYSYESLIRLYNSSFDRFSFDLDMNLTHSTTLQSINSSFENVNQSGGSVLSLGWFLNLEAVDRSEQPISGADVTIKDANEEVVFQGLTDGNGFVNLIPLISYNESADSRGAREWFTPHRIDVDIGNGNGNETVNLSQYTDLRITVNRPPVAALEVNKNVGDSETIFLFSGEESVDDSFSIDLYKFDFGDGESTGWTDKDDASHSYAFAGEFTVTLFVKDYDGAISDPVTVEVTVNNDPRVTLPDSLSGKQGVGLQFDADVYDPDAWDNLHYEWDFGDGENSSLIAPSHVYEDIGNYIVVLTVTDDHGGVGDDLMSVKVNKNLAPEAKAGKDMNVTFSNGANVQFTSHSTDPEGDPLTYLWDFEDGSTSQQEDPNHYFNDPGTYNVTLTVTDDSNATDTDVVQVNVIEYKLTFQELPVREGNQGQKPFRVNIIVHNNGSHDVVVNLTNTVEPVGWISTTLDNITLDFAESRSVGVTVTIPTNALMGISEQYLVVEAGGIEFRGSILIDVVKEAKVDLELENPKAQDGEPGETVIYSLRVINDGSDEDSFNLQVSSFPPGWKVLIQGSTTFVVDNISPTNINYIIIQITIEIPEGEVSGRLTVSILASSVSDPAATASIDIKTTVIDDSGNGGDDSGISGVMVAGFIILLVIIGAVIMSRRSQDLRYAEDEDEDFGDDWDDTPASKGSQKSASSTKEKPRILKCPKCATLLEVPSAKRPITIQCPGCGARAHIKK